MSRDRAELTDEAEGRRVGLVPAGGADAEPAGPGSQQAGQQREHHPFGPGGAVGEHVALGESQDARQQDGSGRCSGRVDDGADPAEQAGVDVRARAGRGGATGAGRRQTSRAARRLLTRRPGPRRALGQAASATMATSEMLMRATRRPRVVPGSLDGRTVSTTLRPEHSSSRTPRTTMPSRWRSRTAVPEKRPLASTSVTVPQTAGFRQYLAHSTAARRVRLIPWTPWILGLRALDEVLDTADAIPDQGRERGRQGLADRVQPAGRLPERRSPVGRAGAGRRSPGLREDDLGAPGPAQHRRRRRPRRLLLLRARRVHRARAAAGSGGRPDLRRRGGRPAAHPVRAGGRRRARRPCARRPARQHQRWPGGPAGGPRSTRSDSSSLAPTGRRPTCARSLRAHRADHGGHRARSRRRGRLPAEGPGARRPVLPRRSGSPSSPRG